MGGGISIFDPKTNTIQNLTTNEGLSNNNVLDILVDENNFVWISTYGGGLNIYNPAKELITIYTTEEGLPDMTILSLIESNKRIYLGTGLGLCIFDKIVNSTNDETYHITSYNKNQGFNTLDFNSKSSLSDYNNHLWWGVGDNLVIMSEPKKNKSIPKIKSPILN